MVGTELPLTPAKLPNFEKESTKKRKFSSKFFLKKALERYSWTGFFQKLTYGANISQKW